MSAKGLKCDDDLTSSALRAISHKNLARCKERPTLRQELISTRTSQKKKAQCTEALDNDLAEILRCQAHSEEEGPTLRNMLTIADISDFYILC